VAGTIVEVNASRGGAPEALNDDPYGAGWICILEPDDPAAVSELLDVESYRRLIEGE